MPLWLVVILCILFVAAAGLGAFVAAIAGSVRTTQGALFVPTPHARVRAALEAVPMDKSTVFYDLGCGDGRVLSTAYTKWGARGTGFEVNLFAYCLASLRLANKPGVRVIRKNFFNANLSDAQVVFCYLFPDVMIPLAEKLAKELSPGARVVCANFPLPGWTHEIVIRPLGAMNYDPIYIYRK